MSENRQESVQILLDRERRASLTSELYRRDQRWNNFEFSLGSRRVAGSSLRWNEVSGRTTPVALAGVTTGFVRSFVVM